MDFGSAARVGKNVAKQSGSDDITGLSAELAYRLLFAIFPFFIFLTALSSFIANAADIEDPAGKIVERIGDAVPEDVGSVLETQLNNLLGTDSGGLLSIGVLGALWAASGATGSAMKAMNRAYNVPESRPFYKKYPVQLGITLVFALSVLAAVVVIFGANLFASEIIEWVGFSANSTFLVYIVQIPLALFLVAFGVSFLYWAGPNIDVPFKWLTPGAALFVVVWLAATLGFAFYVSNFANYNATYGALGGVIVLMMWLYISSLVLLLGAEFNTALEEERDGVSLEERRRQKREEAGEREERKRLSEERPSDQPGRSPVGVIKERPATAGLGALVMSIVFFRAAQR